MLYIIIVVFGIHFVLDALEENIRQKLRSIKNNADYYIIRKRLLRNRRLLFFLFFTILIFQFICFIIDAIQQGNYSIIHHYCIGIMLVALFFPANFRRRGRFDLLAPCSEKKASQIINSPQPYVLYLRSFSHDEFEDDPYRSMRNKQFSEIHFFNFMGTYIQTYAIGRPREIATSVGVERIYVNHQDWMHDVFSLIDKSTLTVSVLGNSDSCRWEIQKLLELRKNSVIIVDDAEAYANCLKFVPLTSNWIQLNQIPALPFVISIRDGRVEFTPMKSTLRGYKKEVKRILGAMSSMKKFYFGQEETMVNRCLLAAFVLACGVLICAFVLWRAQAIELLPACIGGFMSILLCYVLHLRLLYKRRKKTFAEALHLKENAREIDMDSISDTITPALQRHYETVYSKEAQTPEKQEWHMPKILKWMGSSFSVCFFVILGLILIYEPVVRLIVTPIMSIYRINAWNEHTCYVMKSGTDTCVTGYSKSPEQFIEVESANPGSAWLLEEINVKHLPENPYSVPGYVNPQNEKEIYVPAIINPASPFSLMANGISLFIYILAIYSLIYRRKQKKSK